MIKINIICIGKIKEKYGLEVQELSKYARGIELIKKGKREAKEAAAAGRAQAAQYHSERQKSLKYGT